MPRPRKQRQLSRHGPAALLAVAAFVFLMAGLRKGSTAPPAAVETAGKIEAVSLPENGQPVNNGYPDLIRDRQGNLWCAWASNRLRDPLQPYNAGQYAEGDSIVVRVRKGDKWSGEAILNTNFGVNIEPVIAPDPAGGVQVVWTSRRQGEYALYTRHVSAELNLAGEQKILPAGTLEAHPSLVADRGGRIWLAAQAYRHGSMDIVFYAREASGWRQMPDAADSPDPEFRPRLAAAPDGSVWCAWDAESKGKYRVMVRRFDPAANTWGTAEIVPGDGRLDAYAPDLAVDRDGRVWVTYARSEAEEHLWGLRGVRNGDPPRPSVRLVVREPGGWRNTGFVTKGDMPRITIGEDDAVWVAWAFLRGHVNQKVGAVAIRGGKWAPAQVFGWEEPAPVIGSGQRADQRPALAAGPDGRLAIAYEHGRGTFQNRDIYLREVVAANIESAPAAPPFTAFPAEEARSVERPLVRHAPRLALQDIGGERRTLYFGDLHNHLLIDDGHQGTVDQLMMFHRDRFGMDFAATTSHGDSNKLLMSELALNDALAESMLASGQFVSIPGFEWTQGDYVVPRAGHRHVIYETPGGPLYRPTEGYSDSIREFVDLMSKTNGLLFAHHVTRGFTGGTDWSYVNVKVEPDVEMCSHWGRFEFWQNPGHIRGPEVKNCSVQDAWRMGWRLGVIGGSDGHDLYGERISGLTGVYATELTRPAIFDALRKRRCYATTGEQIVLDFRVNGRFMGSEITASDGPVVEAAVTGTAPLIAVEVVKYAGGQSPFATVYKAPVSGAQAKVWWRDPEFRGDSMYYLRVTQQVSPELATRYRNTPDNPFPSEMAWSSPVWVSKE
jgi:hypothetical protein